MSGQVEPKLPHEPVLYQEIIHALRPHRLGKYVDGTVGAGGHAWGILQASSPEGHLLGLDVDPQALELARKRLAEFGTRATLIQTSYTSIQTQIAAIGWNAVDGVLLDFGASSMQFDTPARGFSFRSNGPLDMRFNPDAPVTAADLVNDLPEDELANLIYRYGEERRSRQIVRALVKARPLETTTQLAETVARAVGGRGKRDTIHPATRTFQALRIAVNEELQAIEAVLPQAVAVLAPGGRLAVIAFHSLEDRIVKQYFRQESRDCICPPEQPVCTCGHKASIALITRRPIVPSQTGAETNPRARSARLRVAEKLAVEE